MSKNIEGISALTLAWVGDAVYELHVRTRLLSKSLKANTLSKMAVKEVNHVAQSEHLAAIEDILTEQEKAIVNRGRNTHGSVPKNAKVQNYRRATGFEALLGYLYLKEEHERLDAILQEIDAIKETQK